MPITLSLDHVQSIPLHISYVLSPSTFSQHAGYKRATSYPDYFNLLTPYRHGPTGKTMLIGSTVLTAPGSTYPWGVAGFSWTFETWLDMVSETLSLCGEENTRCFIIDPSVMLLYWNGIGDVNDDSQLFNVFLGDYEPTLMQV